MSNPPESRFGRLLGVLRRLIRFRELNADQTYIDQDAELASKLWGVIVQGTEALGLPWPVELVPVAEELGFLVAEDVREPSALAARLGPSPSALSHEDPGARVQREAGYEATDYAGLFRGAGPFLVTIGEASFALREGAAVSAAGHLRVRSGQLCTFDPRDSTYLDRTVQRLDRAVPPGEHPIHVAHWGRTVAAALVVFGDAPVHCWAPVRFDVERNPMPVPPILPMAQVRYSVGLCDATIMEELLAAATRPQTLQEVNALRTILGEPLLGPDDPPTGAVVHETPAALTTLLEGLHEAPFAVDAGVFGAQAEGPLPASWGLDERGAVVVLALDFGALRNARRDSARALSLAELGAAPEGLLIGGYRFSLGAGPVVVVDEAGGTNLNGVEWTSDDADQMATFPTGPFGSWVPSVGQSVNWDTRQTRWSPPPGQWTDVRLRFASPSRAGVLLERRSLARRLWQQATAAPAGTPVAWEVAGRIGGLLARWCDQGDAARILQGLAGLPLPRVLGRQKSEPVPARAVDPPGLRFDVAGRTVTLARPAVGEPWLVLVMGKPVVIVLREWAAQSTNAATNDDPKKPRVVEGLPIAGDDLLGVTELEIRHDVEGFEAMATWGGKVAGTAVYEIHHLKLLFSEDFAQVEATLSVHSYTSS